MRAKVVSKDMGVGENGSKAWVTLTYSHVHLKSRLWKRCIWIRGLCWGKDTKFELATKAWACKKNSSRKFSQSLTRKCLSWIHISLRLVAPPWGVKTRHHWANKRNKCQAITTKGFCVNLSNGKQNVICHDPNLEFATKGKTWKGANRECNPRVTFALLGVWESVREWIHTLPNGLPLWELESLCSPKFSKKDFKDQNLLY